MTLTDPVAALADDCSFISYLTGLAGLGRLVHAVADPDRTGAGAADDFVHLLLGIASLGSSIEALAESIPDAATPRSSR